MSRPEIEGIPLLARATATSGLGLDFYVPTLTSSNLFVGVLWKASTGAIATIPTVDGAISTLSGFAANGTVGRLTMACWRNVDAGLRRVAAVPSGGSNLDDALLFAVLLRDAGEATSFSALYTNPFTTAVVPSTSRLLSFYWSYGATGISPATLHPVLEVADLGNSLGAFAISTGISNGVSQQTIGYTAPGESSNIAGYAIVPYAAS